MQTQLATKTPEPTVHSQNLAPLQCLVGTWRGSGTCRAGEQTVPISVEWSFSACAGGFGVEGALVILGIPGVARCEQKDLIAYDKADQKLHWVSICTSEEFHDRRGSIDGETLVVSDPSERIRLRFLDDRKLTVDIHADGLTAEAVLTR